MSQIIQNFRDLEHFGRVRLSRTFFMRDFLHSEISQIECVPNLPVHPERAIYAGRMLCESLLEPLQDVFGRIAIRSAYRSPTINGIGNRKGYGCAGNEKNRASHIWDALDDQGQHGATACIVIPWFLDRYEAGEDWRAMAWWIHDHLPYSHLHFFRRLCAFNIGWHETPKRIIRSNIEPTGVLTQPDMLNSPISHSEWYEHWEI